MAKSFPLARRTGGRKKTGDWLFPRLGTADVDQPTLLDVVDNVVNRGMVLNGDLVLGVANVDLIYAKLSVLLAALDKLTDRTVFRPVGGPAKTRARGINRAASPKHEKRRHAK